MFPVCLFLRVGLDGLGWDAYEEKLWGTTLLRFEYAYIGLPALDGLTYQRSENVLGLALSALMKLPPEDRARIKAEGLAKIGGSRENDVRKELLAECFDNYFQLNKDDETEFAKLQTDQQQEEGLTVFNSIEERGRIKALRRLVPKQLEQKFGPLPEFVAGQLSVLSSDQLEEIALRYAQVDSLASLGLGQRPTTDTK